MVEKKKRPSKIFEIVSQSKTSEGPAPNFRMLHVLELSPQNFEVDIRNLRSPS
jgi:hypothetical protein